MRIPRFVKWTALFAAMAVVLTAAMLYWQACRLPAGYEPLSLTPRQKDDAAQSFVRDVMLDFHNKLELRQPFTWTVTELQLNAYLASIDEIAAGMPKVRPGQADAAMLKAGLAEPVVELSPGRLRLMVRMTQYDKVLSADLAVSVAPDGQLRTIVEQAMVGCLRVPSSLVRRQLGRLRSLARGVRDARQDGPIGGSSGPRVDKVALVLAAILDGLAERGIPQDKAWPDVFVEQVDITDDALTLHVVPRQRASRVQVKPP